MYAEIAAVAQSISTLKELLSAAGDLRNRSEIVLAISEINEKLMLANSVALAAQERQSALAQEVNTLKQQLLNLEDWDAEMRRYELFEFPTKTLAYRLKADMANGQPIHYLCPDCINKRVPTKLQPITSDGKTLFCHVCEFRIDTEKRQLYAASAGRNSTFW
jgi:uncharacterized protein YlaI